MPSPRALLRTFLFERFSAEGSFKRFVRDYFAEATAEIPWGESATEQTEAFVGWTVERGSLDKVWPALLQERQQFTDEIQRIRDAWAATAAGNVAPIVLQAPAPAAPLLGEDGIAEIYRALRDAHVDDVRAALFAGLSDALLTSAAARRADAQLLIDLRRLNCAPGNPPPLLLWLQNAQLLFEREPFAGVLVEMIEHITQAPVAMSEPVQSEVTDALSAIVLANSRPAFPVVGNTFEAQDGEWKELVEAKRSFIDAAIAATGRIEAPEDKQIPWIGTGVVVGPELVAVAWHMLPLPSKPKGPLVFNSADRAWEVSEIAFADEHWNIAFLRVPDLDIPPLVSATTPPALHEKVARVTYVVRDPRVDGTLQTQVFRGMLEGGKWVLTGEVTSVPKKRNGEPTERLDRDEMLGYDTNTLGGSGGPVISLETGHLLGYGVVRLYLVGNWAVPMWEVIRDKRVRDLGIRTAD